MKRRHHAQSAATRLGPMRSLRRWGGWMGEVYRARDTKPGPRRHDEGSVPRLGPTTPTTWPFEREAQGMLAKTTPHRHHLWREESDGVPRWPCNWWAGRL